jgi:hypothetical protein
VNLRDGYDCCARGPSDIGRTVGGTIIKNYEFIYKPILSAQRSLCTGNDGADSDCLIATGNTQGYRAPVLAGDGLVEAPVS